MITHSVIKSQTDSNFTQPLILCSCLQSTGRFTCYQICRTQLIGAIHAHSHLLNYKISCLGFHLNYFQLAIKKYCTNLSKRTTAYRDLKTNHLSILKLRDRVQQWGKNGEEIHFCQLENQVTDFNTPCFFSINKTKGKKLNYF